MKKFAVIPNIDKDHELLYTKKLIEIIYGLGSTVFMEKQFESFFEKNGPQFCSFDQLGKSADIAISLGGDGTTISTCRRLAPFNTPVLGINLGHLGFISALEKDDIDGFKKIITGDYKIEERMLLDVTIKKLSGEEKTLVAMNDAVISRGTNAHIIELNLSAGDSEVSKFPADGVIIATPTGSTAYSLSAGGPVVEPGMNAIIITPICPHTMHIRPMIFSGNGDIKIFLSKKDKTSAVLSADGQEAVSIEQEDVVIIKKSDQKARLVRIKERSFYDVLRKKLVIR